MAYGMIDDMQEQATEIKRLREENKDLRERLSAAGINVSRPLSPFPFAVPTGHTVYDELCSCGELRSAHKDTEAFGHGGCNRSGCVKFTWRNFITNATKK